jgi:hypothetical protein
MHIVNEHESFNFVFQAPPGMENCDPLPGMRGVKDGMPVFKSLWKPTVQELEVLKAGGYVALFVYGGGHPPVSLGVEE